MILHGILGGMSSQITSGNFSAGLAAGSFNELVNGEIEKYNMNHPNRPIGDAEAQWVSAALGAIINQSLGENPQTGAHVAVMGTRWNAGLEDRRRFKAEHPEYRDIPEKVFDAIDSWWDKLSEEERFSKKANLAKSIGIKTLVFLKDSSVKEFPAIGSAYAGQASGVKFLADLNTVVSLGMMIYDGIYNFPLKDYLFYKK